ncbi:hypothetical protein GCM10007977_036890 [Dactylosporangium sucinum]|uniref:Uncharacterized protein n=2 Tax=Dactylosporangium sucinum TaxID=1424081 RepID=A0A917TQ70_9ACTN|nr:hypothetical protein GCM10007977_036890 [Dactylosporangium sucinum]
MHDVEERLRSALHHHADDAPAGATMLAAVVEESTRRRRRMAALSAAAAVTTVLTGTAVAVPLLSPSPALTVAAPPTAAPSSLVPSSPASSPPSPWDTSGSASTALVPAKVPDTVTFPFTAPSTPGYAAPSIWRAAGNPVLRQSLQTPQPGGAMAYTTTAYSARPDPLGPTTPTKVHGRPATVVEWSDDVGAQRSLVWQENATTWLELRTEPSAADPETLRAYADALLPKPSSAPSPFLFAVMPSGWTVDNILPGSVTFCPPNVPADQGFTDKLAVMLNATTTPAGRQVQVGDRRGWLAHQDEATTLEVPLGDGRSLLFQLLGKATLPEEDLIRLAAGTTATPNAEVGSG